MNYKIYETIIGKILIEEEEDKISRIEIVKKEYDKKQQKETEIIKKTHEELEEYFKGNRKVFDIPLKIEGTEFQRKVWNALLEIPYGETRTYLDIAKQIGNSKACRAVGMANHNNKIMILIPCHRVIGSNKKLVGYAGGIDVKEKLLEIEKKNCIN